MTHYRSNEASSIGDRLAMTVRKRPEAVLLLAAGCALLMRSGKVGRHRTDYVARRMAQSSSGRSPSDYRRGVEHEGEASAETGRNMAGEIGDAARSYASNIADTMSGVRDTAVDYAESARRNVAGYSTGAQEMIAHTTHQMVEQAQSTYRSVSDVIREQPIVVAALGLVGGAAVAALFPATDLERSTLGLTRDTLAGAAGQASDRLIGAVSEAGERLRETAAEHGLSSQGLQDMARDVADAFANAATGRSDPRSKSDEEAAPQGTKSSEVATQPGPARREGTPTSVAARERTAEVVRRTKREAQTGEGSSGNGPGRS